MRIRYEITTEVYIPPVPEGEDPEEWERNHIEEVGEQAAFAMPGNPSWEWYKR